MELTDEETSTVIRAIPLDPWCGMKERTFVYTGSSSLALGFHGGLCSTMLCDFSS